MLGMIFFNILKSNAHFDNIHDVGANAQGGHHVHK